MTACESLASPTLSSLSILLVSPRSTPPPNCGAAAIVLLLVLLLLPLVAVVGLVVVLQEEESWTEKRLWIWNQVWTMETIRRMMTTSTRSRLRIGPHGSFFFCGCVCVVDDEEEDDDVEVEVQVMADNGAREVVEVPGDGACSADTLDWGVMNDMIS